MFLFLCVSCVIRNVSGSYTNTDLIFELNILRLVLSLICFALQIFLNMRNATLAFCILALTSSSVPPLLLMLLPRYLKESVSSSGSSPSVTVLLVFV